MSAKVRTTGEQAMHLLNEPIYTERQAMAAQAWAILDLADAIRQAGRTIAAEIDACHIGLSQLAEAIDRHE